MKIINKRKSKIIDSHNYNDFDTKIYKVKKVHLNIREHRAYSIFKLGKDIGLAPERIFTELKENNIKGAHMRNGIKAYELEKKGFIIMGDSDKFMANYKKQNIIKQKRKYYTFHKLIGIR